MNDQHLTIRAATPGDHRALRRLAELDSAPLLSGHVLLAELGERPVAAVSLGSGAVAADPFRPTADVVRMLRLRRDQLLRRGGDVALARSLSRRFAATPAR